MRRESELEKIRTEEGKKKERKGKKESTDRDEERQRERKERGEMTIERQFQLQLEKIKRCRQQHILTREESYSGINKYNSMYFGRYFQKSVDNDVKTFVDQTVRFTDYFCLIGQILFYIKQNSGKLIEYLLKIPYPSDQLKKFPYQ